MGEITKFWLRTAAVVLWLIGVVVSTGCKARLCQPLPSTPFSSVSATKWWMTYTTNTNPNFPKLSPVTALLMTFPNTGSGGTVEYVENNELENEPLQTFSYNISVGLGQIIIQYLNRGEKTPTTQPVKYKYRLSKMLELKELSTGFTYLFMPYSGDGAISDLDEKCSLPTTFQ